MFKTPEKVTVLALFKRILLIATIGYCGIATYLLLRLKPQTLLIGIDPYGTRIIRESGDRLLKSERENFLKHFLGLLYNYDLETYEKQISASGDLMSDSLWKEKSEEFERIGNQLKVEKLAQSVEVKELREIDEGTYQADLLIHIQRRLTEHKVNLRVEVKVRPNPRQLNNPYPYEVERYDEQQIN